MGFPQQLGKQKQTAMGNKFYQAYAGKFLPALVEKFSVCFYFKNMSVYIACFCGYSVWNFDWRYGAEP